MKKLYMTNEARDSHINNIGKLINILGGIKSSELDYISYREIVKYLSEYRDLIKEEKSNSIIYN